MKNRLRKVQASKNSSNPPTKADTIVKKVKEIGVITTIMIIAVSLPTVFFTGMVLGNSQLHVHAEEGLINTNNQSGETFDIDGYKITMIDQNHSLVEDRLGFTYSTDNTTIYIQDNLRPETTYRVCVHEKLHNLGMDGGETYSHEMVYKYDTQIKDDTCLRLLYNLEPRELQVK